MENRRKTETEKNQSGDYFGGSKRYYDQISEVTVVKVFSGEWYTTNKPGEVLVTVLGSCVSACIRDVKEGIGGMNHFLLPATASQDGTSARYGAFAMEELINSILKQGGKRENLEIKVFGGGNVIESSAMIGDKNSKFVREYLGNEGLKITTEDLGGTSPRRIHYYPDTGKVMVRKLSRKEDFDNVTKEETTYQSKINKTSKDESEDDIELF